MLVLYLNVGSANNSGIVRSVLCTCGIKKVKYGKRNNELTYDTKEGSIHIKIVV